MRIPTAATSINWQDQERTKQGARRSDRQARAASTTTLQQEARYLQTTVYDRHQDVIHGPRQHGPGGGVSHPRRVIAGYVIVKRKKMKRKYSQAWRACCTLFVVKQLLRFVSVPCAVEINYSNQTVAFVSLFLPRYFSRISNFANRLISKGSASLHGPSTRHREAPTQDKYNPLKRPRPKFKFVGNPRGYD